VVGVKALKRLKITSRQRREKKRVLGRLVINLSRINGVTRNNTTTIRTDLITAAVVAAAEDISAMDVVGIQMRR